MLLRGEHVYIPFDADGKAFTGSGKIRLFQSIDKAEKVGFFEDSLVEYAPVRVGRYIADQRYRTIGNCGECGGDVTCLNNYCPNCGAKMKGGESDA